MLDDDGYWQIFDVAHVRPSVFGQVLLRERWKSVVEFTARLGGDGVHHKRRLARARHARNHGNLPFGNPYVDMFEVVLAGIADDDIVEVVGVFHKVMSLVD